MADSAELEALGAAIFRVLCLQIEMVVISVLLSVRVVGCGGRDPSSQSCCLTTSFFDLQNDENLLNFYRILN